MPETNKNGESPKTPDKKKGVDELGADVKAAKDEALRDARSTVTKAGKVMDIVEQGDLTERPDDTVEEQKKKENRRNALKVLKEKLTNLQARIDRTEGVAEEIEQTLARINKKVEQEEALKTDIALAEAQKYMTNPAAWNEFIGYAKGVLRRQEYLGNDAASHADDTKLTALNAQRLAAIDAYSKSTPQAPTNWQPDRDNQARMLGALQALATLEDVTEQYEKYRGIVDGVRKLGDRAFVVPLEGIVTLDVRRNNSQSPSTITLDSTPNSTYTSDTQDLNIKRTEGGWEVTMKPDFTGRLFINRGTTKEGWNSFDIGQSATVATAQPEAKKTPQQPTPKSEKTPPAVAQEKKSSGLRARGLGSSPEPEDESKKKEAVQSPEAAKTNTAPKQKDIIPTSGEITLPTNQTVFVRPKNSQVYHYLRPDYVGHWTLGNFADADRSADGSRWIIKPKKGTTALETSLDGRTWTDAGTTEKTAPKAAPPKTPTSEATGPKKAPAAAPTPAKDAPQKTAPATEKREEVPNTEVVQTSATTLEFPATNPVRISYKTAKAQSQKPWELRTKVSKLDFYLYSIVKEKGVWKFAMKPGQSGDITLSLASGVTKTFRLGENVPFDAKKTPTPSLEKGASVPPPPPEATPLPKAAPTPSKGQEITARGMATPANKGETAQVKKTDTGSTTAEKMDATYARFNAIYKDYTSTIVKDYENMVFKRVEIFNQAFEQLMAEMELHLGDSPRFVDLKKWKANVKTKEQKAVENVCADMEKLLATYKTTKLEKKAPITMQRIDTTKGNPEDAKQNIEKYRKAIVAKGGPRAKEFASLDALYTESYALAKTNAAKKAILVCHEALAKNYATAKEGEKDSVFGSMFSMVSDATSFRPGMDTDDLRMQLIERSERTPFNVKLSPQELVRLMAWKHTVDALRADTTLTEQQRHDQIGKYFANHYSVFEGIRKNAVSQMTALKAMGYDVDIVMNDVINPETIDWLVATHVSATPVKGMSDHTFFAIYPIKASGKVTPKTASPETPKTTEKTPAKKSPIQKTIGATVEDLTTGKDDEEKFPGRLLSTKEVQDLGLKLLKGEKAKELDDGSYIACTKNSCRPIKSKAQLEEALAKKKDPPKEAASDTKTKAPEKNNGITANGREFRIAANETFTVTYNPPVSGSSSVTFNPQIGEAFDGVALKAKKYSDLWVVNIVPHYEGTVTLTRARDKATATLAVKADPAAIAALEKAKDLTVREITTEAEFNELVLNSPVPVIVDLYATWCQPCKDMQSDLEAVAKESGGGIRVVKVDGEKFSRIQTDYAPKQDGQYKFPTLLVFEKGRHLRGAIGRRTRDKIRELLPPLEGSNITMR